MDSSTAVFETAACRVLRAWPTTERAMSLSHLLENVYKEASQTRDIDRKKHHTPGYFCACILNVLRVRRAACALVRLRLARPDWSPGFNRARGAPA